MENQAFFQNYSFYKIHYNSADTVRGQKYIYMREIRRKKTTLQ